jgi:hypothetical protein
MISRGTRRGCRSYGDYNGLRGGAARTSENCPRFVRMPTIRKSAERWPRKGSSNHRSARPRLPLPRRSPSSDGSNKERSAPGNGDVLITVISGRARRTDNHVSQTDKGGREVANLTAGDLATLGRYVFGPRWQAALAREMGVSRQLIVYWASGKRPVTKQRSLQIAVLARAKHDRRVLAERSSYVAMSSTLASEQARSVLLSMIANEVSARVETIAALTRDVERTVAKLSQIARHEALRDHPPDGHDTAGRARRPALGCASRPSGGYSSGGAGLADSISPSAR